MVNRMSSAFRLTPQGSRSTPPPSGQSIEDNNPQQQHNHGEHSAVVGSPPSTSMANAVENPAVAVAEGIANGIVGSTQIGWCLDNLPNGGPSSAIRVQQHEKDGGGGNDVRLFQSAHHTLHIPREVLCC